MNGRRIERAVIAGLALTGLGFAGWAFGAMTTTSSVPPRAPVGRVVAGPPITTTTTTTAAVVRVPVPGHVPAVAQVPHTPSPRVTAPAPVTTTTTTTTQPVVLIPPLVVEKPACPSDGTEFAYGSCVLPVGVHDTGADLAFPSGQPVAVDGAPSKLVDACGGIVLVPASYTPPVGVVCDPEVGQ